MGVGREKNKMGKKQAVDFVTVNRTEVFELIQAF